MRRVVLVVDDAGAVRQVAKWMFEFHGFEVLTAETGQIALDQFRDLCDEIELVLLDYRLPDITGVEVAAGIRAIKPQIPVIFCSGEVQESLRLGPRDVFLNKPFDLESLESAIHKLTAHN